MKYGFMLTGFKTRIFFWEIVIIGRKILLVMLTVFLTVVSPDTQVLAGLLCLILSMILHVKFEPYAAARLNRMEHYSLQVTSLTIYAGTFYVTGGDQSYMKGDGVKWFFFFLIILPNCAFFIHWMNQMRIEVLKMALQKGKRAFNLISCGLVDAEEFRKTHIINGENDLELEDGMERTQKYTHAQNRTSDTHFN